MDLSPTDTGTSPIPFLPEMIEQSVPLRFRAVADRYPERIAVTDEHHSISYGKLQAWAARLAKHLVDCLGETYGVIGLLLPHELSIIVGLMGTLQANKAYVALDPTTPKQRLAGIVTEANVCLVVTDEAHRPVAEMITNQQIVCIDNLPTPTNRPLPSIPSADTPAGLFFTSGTTGKAKIITRAHRYLLQRAWYENQVNQFLPTHCVTLLVRCHFGASVSDMCNALLNGATLALYDFPTRGLTGMSEWLESQRVSHFHIPVELFRHWLDTLPAGAIFPHLQQIIPAGRIFRHDLERARQHVSQACVFLSRYASTETGLVTRLVIDHNWQSSDDIVPVGYPVQDKQLYILDENGQPAPAGTIGEIVVESRYLGNWSGIQSNQSGIPRHYTGDLGRLQADGCLEFWGRRDTLVKIRGYRVVLVEVENALQQLPNVQRTVVIAHQPAGSTTTRLVAYIVPAGPLPLNPATLRQDLAAILPDYMIPGQFITLSEIPLTSNGKVNQRALPAPPRTRPDLSTPFAPPETPIEKSLAALWAELLAIDEIGINDHFLNLGGHSLLAAQILTRIQANYGQTFPPLALFDYPTVAQLAAQVKEPISAPAGEQPTRSEGEPVLSFTQERLWFLQQLDPIVPFFNMPKTLEMSGRIHLAALEQALQKVIARHKPLQQVIQVINGQPRPRLKDDPLPKLTVIDLSQVADPSTQLEQLLAAETSRPFDLTHDLPIRYTLFRLSAEQHTLHLVTHHLATDRFASVHLLNEIRSFYNAFTAGQPVNLPPLLIEYHDFAIWQRKATNLLATQAKFWQQQLADLPPLDFPTDFPHPARQTYPGRRHPFTIDQERTSQLQALSRANQTTLFATMLTTLHILLYRYTGQKDFGLGVVNSQRRHQATEQLVGAFINPIVIRAKLNETLTGRESLAQTQQTTLEALNHPDLPFEQVVELCQPTRDLSRSPLFQVMFDFVADSPTTTNVNWDQLTVEQRPAYNNHAPYDLSLYLVEQNGLLTGAWEYNTDLFRADTIGRLNDHWQHLLGHFLANPDLPLDQLELVPPAEIAQMAAWNQTTTPYPEACLHELFAQQVSRSPEATALISGSNRLTFAELDNRANQLAHFLQSQGVGPEMAIGVALPRAPELIIALLAIFKAGGAYVPLDPAYPAARLEWFLSDTALSLIISDRTTTAKFEGFPGRIIHLDTFPWNDDSPATPKPVSLTPDNLAYIVYTSGSTGRPKGVMGIHRSSVSRINWMWHTYPFAANELIAHKTSLNFIDSISEIFGSLLQGQPILLIPEETMQDPLALSQLLSQEKVTRLVLVPSLLRALLDIHPDLGQRLPALKWWISSGEALPRELCDRFYAAHPSAILLNLYGTSEVAPDATHFDTRQLAPNQSLVPIGRPLDNCQLHILDAQHRPLPIGLTGELYIGGVYLARGYWQRPDLTAERFLDLPSVGRLFKTGDLARYLPDGQVEYRGRLDHQVKIRGYRIEPAEIEAALEEHPAITQAIVMASPNNQSLIAYYATDQPQNPSTLRAFLAQTLPDYMLPAQFVALEALPLTPNGKVNRLALPKLEAMSQPRVTLAPPKTTIQQHLTQIWANVLGAPMVGINDNFFDLGGYSLLAVSLFSQIEAVFGVRLPLTTLFQAPTIESLAPFLEQAKQQPPSSSLVTIRPAGSRPPLFCVHGIGGHVLHYYALAQHLGKDQPVYGLQTVKHQTYNDIPTMAGHYLQLITELQPAGPYFLCGLSFGGFVAVEMARQLCEQGRPVGLVALFDTSALIAPAFRRSLPLRNLLYLHLKTWQTKIDYHLRRVRSLPISQQATYVWHSFKQRSGRVVDHHDWGLDVPESEPDLQAILSTNQETLLSYEPRPYPGKITLFKSATHGRGRYYGWDEIAAGGVTVYEIPGTHVSILDEPNVSILAAKLQEIILA